MLSGFNFYERTDPFKPNTILIHSEFIIGNFSIYVELHACLLTNVTFLQAQLTFSALTKKTLGFHSFVINWKCTNVTCLYFIYI